MNREFRYRAHGQIVAAWIEKNLADLSPAEMVESFEVFLHSLIRQTRTSISEVTLAAVLDRVLYNSSEQYPILKTLKQKNAQLSFSDLKSLDVDDDETEIKEAFHYLLTEIIFILGNLTGEQITPLLHGELDKVSASEAIKKEKKKKKDKR